MLLIPELVSNNLLLNLLYKLLLYFPIFSSLPPISPTANPQHACESMVHVPSRLWLLYFPDSLDYASSCIQTRWWKFHIS